MAIKLLLAAGAVLASVALAQAQDRGAAGFMFPSQAREVDTSFNGEDATTQRLRPDGSTSWVQSDSLPTQAKSRIMFPSQAREVDTSFNGEDATNDRLHLGGSTSWYQSDSVFRVAQVQRGFMFPSQAREVDTSLGGDDND